MKNCNKLFFASALGSLLSLSAPVYAETIRIGIGHQSMVTNTVAGGVLLEKLSLLEQHLPKTGKYADVTYKIEFRDYDSGPPITNQMLAAKLDFGVMGDYPLLVNGAKFQETGRHETRFIGLTGYNLRGSGNGIVVPVSSDIHSLEQLAGKSISMPIGSAAWGMSLKVLRDADLISKVSLINQAPPVGAANIAASKIDAHADFCPWSEIMEFRGTGRKIYDASQANIPTFHGIVVRNAFAERYPEIVEAFLKATLAAQAWIKEDPVRAATQLAEWTGVEKEVLYLYLSEGGISTMEASIKPQWVTALKEYHALLQNEMNIGDLDLSRWIDESFLVNAHAAAGLDYPTLKASVVDQSLPNPSRKPAQIWFATQGVVDYNSVAEMLAAQQSALQNGERIFSTYVYDHLSGLKLFGKTAFYVKTAQGEIISLMRKADAERLAQEGGVMLDRQQLLAQLP